jgi:hypothetical protein
MGDYVPPKERARRARSSAETATAEAEQSRLAWVDEVHGVLRRLDGRGADYYLEILRSAKGPRWFYRARGKTIVSNSGWRGGPHFFISEVLDAYRVPAGIFHSWRKDPGGMSFDALVATDGRIWGFSGAGETENTYQLLASSMRRVMDLSEPDLRRIAAGLEQYLASQH